LHSLRSPGPDREVGNGKDLRQLTVAAAVAPQRIQHVAECVAQQVEAEERGRDGRAQPERGQVIVADTST